MKTNKKWQVTLAFNDNDVKVDPVLQLARTLLAKEPFYKHKYLLFSFDTEQEAEEMADELDVGLGQMAEERGVVVWIEPYDVEQDDPKDLVN